MNIITKYSFLLFTILMHACSSDDLSQESTTENEITKIEAIVSPFMMDEANTRTTFWMGDYGEYKDIVWAEGDTIGIYPSEGDQLSFPIVEGIGKTVSEFNGGGWALKASTATETYTYSAYTPFNRNYYFLKENKALPVSMIGQKQKGNNTSSHLGAYDLQIAQGTTPTNGKISFAFEHQVAFVRMDITAPCKAVWKSIELDSDAAFITEATMNLTTEMPALTPKVQSNSVTLDLENVNTNDNLHLVAYMMMLPIDFTDKTLNLTLKDSDNNIYTAPVTIVNANKNFRASYYKWIKAEFEEGVAPTIPYVTFRAADEQTLTMSKAVETLEYSVGGNEWKELGTNTVTFGGENGNLQLRGKSSTGTATSTFEYSKIIFGNSSPVTCSGDIRTLIDYANYATTNTANARFCSLFQECSSLITAPKLPITTLADECYYNMFNCCFNLTTAPQLPATILSEGCYNGMFKLCRKLTTAPNLPATILTKSCYYCMFDGCSNLSVAPQLPAKILAEYCYNSMFMDCINLTTAPQLPATTLTDYCYGSMFMGCTSLTTAPQIEATTLAYYCCQSMFSGCTGLISASKLPATTLAASCYKNMFYQCTSLITAPQLPAPKLEGYCYEYMFYGCSKLNNVTILATDISASSCLSGWLKGVASSGTFTKAAAMTSMPSGESGIPSGWTVQDYNEQ